MRTADFGYVLPPELIAQQPAAKRDQSRLLVLHRETGHVEHRQFHDFLEFLRAGDVLVLNNSRVIPARLRGVNAQTGGQFEILLLEENAPNDWWVMLRPGKRARIGTQINVFPGRWRGNQSHPEKKSKLLCGGSENLQATVTGKNTEGHRRLHFEGVNNILHLLAEIGEVPLPPYIRRKPGTPNSCSARTNEAPRQADQQSGALAADAERALDRERYQTVFAEPSGSVAAPTAGLHFTDALLENIRALGVGVHCVTLHVGFGTFAPVKAETLAGHTMHAERYEVSEAAAHAVNEASATGQRVVAVGTTTVRVLESVAAQNAGKLVAGRGRTRIFIHPPYDFKVVDSLLTNFHLPCSTLLMLVSAFASPGQTRGRDLVLSAYAEAIRECYRFFSYGDAMFIL